MKLVEISDRWEEHGQAYYRVHCNDQDAELLRKEAEAVGLVVTVSSADTVEQALRFIRQVRA